MSWGGKTPGEADRKIHNTQAAIKHSFCSVFTRLTSRLSRAEMVLLQINSYISEPLCSPPEAWSPALCVGSSQAQLQATLKIFAKGMDKEGASAGTGAGRLGVTFGITVHSFTNRNEYVPGTWLGQGERLPRLTQSPSQEAPSSSGRPGGRHTHTVWVWPVQPGWV